MNHPNQNHPGVQPTFGRLPRLKAGTYLFIGIASLIAIFLMTNLLASKYYCRFAIEKNRPGKLSPQTITILNSITNPVVITVFFEPEEDETLYNLVVALVRELSYANPSITYRLVDPNRKPAEAEKILAAYKLTSLKHRNFVIIDSNNRSKVLFANELGDYRIDIIPQEGQAEAYYRRKLTAFKGEQLIVEAMFSLAFPPSGKIYFLQGHGEHDPELIDHPHGYSKFAEMLSLTMNIPWEKLWLSNKIPDDCAVLIIAGARLPLASEELELIDAYLKKGGRLFVLLPSIVLGDDSRLETLLTKWGVRIPKKLVVDPQFSPTGSDLLTAGLNGEHQITRALLAASPDTRLRLVLPRPVSPLQETGEWPAAPDKPKVYPLLFTSEAAYEASSIRNDIPQYNPLNDQKGRLSLGAAIEYGAVRGISLDRGLTRIVVVGDSLFIDNELIDSPPANRQFARLAVNWLLDRPREIFQGTWQSPVKEYVLLLTPSQQSTLKWVFLVIIPGGFIVIGAFVWWWRR